MVQEAKPPGLLLKVSAAGILLVTWFVVFFPWIRYQFWQSDTWWLIETGRLIIRNHALPSHDPFSFTVLAANWTVYQWGTEVLFGLAHAFDGLAGVALLGGMVMSTLLFILIFRHMIRGGTNSIVAVLAITLCAYSYFPDFASLRPQLFSFVLFWLMIVICAQCKNDKTPWKALLQTFIIAVIWANCHISFPVALLLLSANLAGALLDLLRKKCDKKQPLLFIGLLVTFFLGTFITPFGLTLWAFIGNTHNLFYTQEVGPLVWSEQPLLMTTAIISLLSFIVLALRKKVDAGDLLTLLGLLFVGTNCIRLIVYFCIFSCPMIGAAVSLLFQDLLNWGPIGRFGAALKAVALSKAYIPAMIVFTAFVVLIQPTRIPRNIPVEAAKYLSEHPIPGNMFCSAHAGSYLIYSAHGAIPVFMDTRVDVYPADFLKSFLATLVYGTNWKETFSKYKITAALLPNDVKLRRILDEQPDWKCIYRDSFFSLFVPGVEPEQF